MSRGNVLVGKILKEICLFLVTCVSIYQLLVQPDVYHSGKETA